MKNVLRALSLAAVVFITMPVHAITYTYRNVDAPAATAGTQARGITTLGAIAGTYRDGNNGNASHGFIVVNSAYTAINNPAAQPGTTEVLAINDRSQAVGNYTVSGGISRAFQYLNGVFTPVNPPNAARGTRVTGINNMGSIIGEYVDSNGTINGFVNKGAAFFPIVHPKARAGTTRVTGINNTGWQSGYYSDARGTHGFLAAGGIFTTIDHPSADSTGTIVTAVNASVAITGFYRTADGARGFVYMGSAFSPVDVPGATLTIPTGINDNGVVVGYYVSGGVTRGFIAAPEQVAVRAVDFTNRFGVNTHIDYTTNRTFDSLDTVVTALQYLKLRNVRDSPTENSAQSWAYVAQRTGAKFDAYIPSGSPTHMKDALDVMPGLARAGLLNFIEGPNEEDNPFPISMGNSLSYSAQFQTWVYQVGRSLRLPVINMSFGSGWSETNNWSGNYDKVGDLSAIADYANGHTFPEPGIGQPDLTFQMVIRNAHLAASQRPLIHTEFGWDYRTPEAQVPTALLQGVFDAIQNGAVRAYLYALFDEAGGHTFGLMNGNGTPKPEGTAFRNLWILLEDTGDGAGTFTPGTLYHRITTTTGGDRTYLMQKSSGTYILAIWNEILVRHPVTVTLNAPAAQIRVFNPVASTAAVQTLTNVSAVTVDMVGAPILLAITPTSNASNSRQAPNTISSSANNTVIDANPGTTSIAVHGTGNTVNGSAGTYSVTALAGNTTINAGDGTAAITISGSGNRINFGSGPATVRDSGTNGVYTFGPPGSGNADIYGHIFNQGASLNLRALLAGTQWAGDRASLGNFLKLTTVGPNTVLTVNTSGLSSGVTYPVAVLHDNANLSFAALLAQSTF